MKKVIEKKGGKPIGEDASLATTKGKYDHFTGWICWGKNEGWVEDADFELVQDDALSVVKFNGGIWIDGVMYRGQWNRGIWKNGIFEGGDWRRGTWWNGSFRGAEWHSGMWHNGVFESSYWHGGIWDSGVWKSGMIWKYPGLRWMSVPKAPIERNNDPRWKFDEDDEY